MMQSQAKDGSLHAHPPAETMGQRIVDFMLTWVLSLHDHYWFTGRTSALEQSFPALVKLLDEFFKRRETDDGLLSDFPGFWVFLDWADLHKSPYSAVMNLMYLQALRRAADVAQILGEEAHQQRWSQRAAHVEAMIDKFFWDPEESCWRDGFDIAKGERVEKISQQANTLGILLNLHPEHHAAIARERLYKPAKAKRSKIVTGSPFFYAYVLEAMIQAGLRKEAIEIIKQRWGVMLDDGATTFYEIWDPTQGGGSHCHAWSASPLFHLSQQILGAVPAAPGWTKVRIAPLPLDLEFARGTVPTPLGRLRIEWESAGEDQLAVRVDVPAGMDVEFVGPDGTTRNLSAGRNEFQA
jgi:alpha-L-rhamnosidase